VQIKTDEQMMFAGSTEPCAIATLKSIGAIGGDKNKAHSDKLFKHVHEKLGISKDRSQNALTIVAERFLISGCTFSL
jgi:hypothetical protein